MALLKMCRCGKIIPQALVRSVHNTQQTGIRNITPPAETRERMRSTQAPNGAKQERSACNTPEDWTCMRYMWMA